MRVVASERQLATAVPCIPSEEWKRRVQAVQVRKEHVNALVLNYLLTEGFAHAAAHFQEESGTSGTFRQRNDWGSSTGTTNAALFLTLPTSPPSWCERQQC
jgi:hypothetical protein